MQNFMRPQATVRSRRHNALPMPHLDRSSYIVAIASRIAAARKLAGLTQRDLAKALGTNERAVRAWEAGDHMPGADLVGRLAALCRRSSDWILGRPDGDIPCLIHPAIEAGILAKRQDENALLRNLRLCMVVDAAVESVPLVELSQRLAAVAKSLQERSSDGHDAGEG